MTDFQVIIMREGICLACTGVHQGHEHTLLPVFQQSPVLFRRPALMDACWACRGTERSQTAETTYVCAWWQGGRGGRRSAGGRAARGGGGGGGARGGGAARARGREARARAPGAAPRGPPAGRRGGRPPRQGARRGLEVSGCRMRSIVGKVCHSSTGLGGRTGSRHPGQVTTESIGAARRAARPPTLALVAARNSASTHAFSLKRLVCAFCVLRTRRLSENAGCLLLLGGSEDW